MAPFQFAETELEYPLYAVEFDREDANRLVVSGGGGANRSGVENKITVLETVSQNELREAGSLSLSRDEDSVMSLALAPSNKPNAKRTYLYAGVNSSPTSIAKGQNQHFRTLAIEGSKTRQSAGTKGSSVKLEELGRTSMFEHVDADSYQRLLRVATGGVGVAASALGQQPELAVFEVEAEKVKVKGVLDLPREAEDIDVIQTGEESWQVAFCHKFQLFTVNIGKGQEQSEPEEIWVTPEESPRPTFRSIRYLSKDFIMAAVNLPNRSGVVLQGFRLPSVSATGERKPARMAVTARINRKISATALSVTNLNTPLTPYTALGDTQFLVALAGSDASISIYSLEHFSSASIDLIRKLSPLTTLTDTHSGGSLTGLAFSTFLTPQKTQVRAQYVKLASISLQKTVAVHSIPLKKHVDKAQRSSTKEKKGAAAAAPRQVRYITAMEPRHESPRALIYTLAVMVLIMAVVGQTIMELYSSNHTPVLNVQKYLPSWHGTLRSPAQLSDNLPPAAAPAGFLAEDFLSKLSQGRKYGPGETLMLWQEEPTTPSTNDGEQPEATSEAKGLQLDVHDVTVHGPGKTWDELAEEQKEAWRQKLGEAGAWTQGMGESVFRGILFGELRGIVRGVVGG